MKTQKTIQRNMNRAAYSGSLALTLASIIAAAAFAFPAAVWSQTAEWTVYNTANSGLPYNGVTALAIDAQGNIWVGTGRWWAHAGGGLAKFDGTNWTVYKTSNSELPDNDHVSLSIDAQGNIWSGTEGGLAKFDGANWTVYKTHNSGLPSNHAGAPAFDAEGNAWIGTFPNGGLAKFDGENWTVYNTGNSGLPNNFITGFAIDAQGNIWAGTMGSGLVKFDGTNWTVYNTANSGLPHNDTSFLSIDGQDNVWIGTYGGGLAKFDGTNWMAYNSANSGLPNNWIWNLTVGVQGKIWAGTRSGLAKFDGTKWTVYNTANSGLPDNNVYFVAFDVQANAWIGTQSGGLVVYRDGGQPTVDFNGDGIVDRADMYIMVDHWGQNYPLCDIGPTPLGDGIVDIQDMVVLAEHLFEGYRLVAHWKLDETEGTIAYDNIVGDKLGTVNGEAVWQPVGGKIDGALEFDGIDDYVSTPFILDPAVGAFSVFAWVKGGAAGQVIISQTDITVGRTTRPGSAWLGTDASDGRLMTGLMDTSFGPLESESVITDGQWHHVGLVYDFDGLYRYLYVDGAEVAKDTEAVGGVFSDGGLHFGAGKDLDAASFFFGLIDDVRIYDAALSAEEIEALAQ